MALPNDFFADASNGSPGSDLPALTPQWMLSRSNSSGANLVRHLS